MRPAFPTCPKGCDHVPHESNFLKPFKQTAGPNSAEALRAKLEAVFQHLHTPPICIPEVAQWICHNFLGRARQC